MQIEGERGVEGREGMNWQSAYSRASAPKYLLGLSFSFFFDKSAHSRRCLKKIYFLYYILMIFLVFMFSLS